MQQLGRILVVDDNPTNIQIVEELLADEHLVRTATSGAEALAIAAEFDPDVILLDIMMPGIDGYTVCQTIRADDRLAHTKVVMVSAKAMVEERLKGYEAGADDYITKPFDHDELCAKVDVFLRLKSIEEVDELKTDLLRVFAHETRTPLSAVMAPAAMLMSEQPVTASERQNLAKLIHHGAAELLVFFENALEYATIRGGVGALERKPVSLAVELQAATTTLDVLAKEHCVSLESNAGDASVAGDARRIRDVLRTLIDQTIRSSAPGATVGVEVSLRNGEGVVEITSHRPRDDDEDTDAGGSLHAFSREFAGLELALAKEIVRAHGGTVRVVEEPGAPARIILSLPASPGDEAISAAAA